MIRMKVLTGVACLGLAAGATHIHASAHDRTLVVTMTNDPNANEIKVYDADSHALLQTLSTHGKGGVGGNARGIKQFDRTLVAVVNNGLEQRRAVQAVRRLAAIRQAGDDNQRARQRRFRQ